MGEGKKYHYSIALIDDDEATRAVYRTKFNLEHFTIFEAKTGKEALVVIKKHKPSIILLDIFLPGIDGFKVLEKLKKDHSSAINNIPVVILTNLAEDVGHEHGIKLGAVSYVMKSRRTPDQVVQLVKAVLKDTESNS